MSTNQFEPMSWDVPDEAQAAAEGGGAFTPLDDVNRNDAEEAGETLPTQDGPDLFAAAGEPEPAGFVIVDGEPLPEAGVIARLADDSEQAVALFRDPDAVRELTRSLTASLVLRVQMMHGTLKDVRPEGKVTQATVAPEVQLLADAYDTLTAVSKAVGTGAAEAQALLGDIVAEVVPDKADAGTGSVRVGDGHGSDVKVTRTQATKVQADTDVIVDVLVARMVTEHAATLTPPVAMKEVKAYADGLRQGISALLGLISPPTWKTTALDALATRLEDAQDFDNSIKLGHAYGRVAQGDPKTKVERVQRKAAK